MSTIIQELERAQLREVPRFKAGDTVRVHFKVIEGARHRIQVFEGICIGASGRRRARDLHGAADLFGVGVEGEPSRSTRRRSTRSTWRRSETSTARSSTTCAAGSGRRRVSRELSRQLRAAVSPHDGHRPLAPLSSPRWHDRPARSCSHSIAGWAFASSPGPTRPGAGRSPGRSSWPGRAASTSTPPPWCPRPPAQPPQRDSKQVASSAREELYRAVLECATRVSVHIFPPAVIDREGLHASNLRGLRDALAACQPADACLVDGFRLGPGAPPHRAVVDGDAKSAAVAAASIVAKVTRDRYMHMVDALYPGYGFVSHVGYITPSHSAAVRRIGPSEIHRRSFRALCYTSEPERRRPASGRGAPAGATRPCLLPGRRGSRLALSRRGECPARDSRSLAETRRRRSTSDRERRERRGRLRDHAISLRAPRCRTCSTTPQRRPRRVPSARSAGRARRAARSRRRLASAGEVLSFVAVRRLRTRRHLASTRAPAEARGARRRCSPRPRTRRPSEAAAQSVPAGPEAHAVCAERRGFVPIPAEPTVPTTRIPRSRRRSTQWRPRWEYGSPHGRSALVSTRAVTPT